MGITLINIQALTAHPTVMLIPYIKASNTTVCRILTLLPFEPNIYDRLYHRLMGNLLQSLLVSTSTYFITK